MNVFIAGARAISVLDKPVQDRLNNIYRKGYTVLVGDAAGVDSAVQKYFSKLDYRNVFVYASEGKARNNHGSWEVRGIDVPDRLRGFNYYAVKDKAMADDADYGYMIWNGESKGTLNNVVNLLKQDKNSLVYLTSEGLSYNIENIDNLQELVLLCSRGAQSLYAKMCNDLASKSLEQFTFY